MRRDWVMGMVVGVLLIVPAVGRAQPKPPMVTEGKPAEGAAELAYVATGGNSTTQTIGVSGDLALRPPLLIVETKLAFLRQTADGETQAKSFNWLLRGSRRFRERYWGFGQYDYLRNLFAGVEHRHGAEAGISCQVIEGDRHRLVLDGGLGYARELRVAAENRTSATAAAGANYKLKVSGTTDLINELRAVQSLDEVPDWRANNQLSLATKINAILSLKVSHTLRYVNDPVPGFERRDTIARMGVVAKF